jgi:4-hydroxy-3-polyprenylbenzoate decarboxylase
MEQRPDVNSLGEFLAAIQDRSDLVRVRQSIEPSLELTEIVRRLQRSPGGGPAVIVEAPTQAALPLAANLYGSAARVGLALGVDDPASWPQSGLSGESANDPASRWWSWWSGLGPRSSTASVVKIGPCQQTVRLGRDFSLWDLPVPRHWPDEPLACLTGGILWGPGPSGQANCLGTCLLALLDRWQLVPLWNTGSPGWTAWQAAVSQQRQFPIAVSFGGSPAAFPLASVTRPPGISWLDLLGQVPKASTEFVAARTQPVEVPAHSDVVIEGYIDHAAELAPIEGMVLSTGLPNLQSRFPVIQVTAMTQRAQAIWPAVVPGPGWSEWSRWGELECQLWLPWLQRTRGDLHNLRYARSATDRELLYLSLRKQHAGQASAAASFLRGLPPFADSRWLIVVDAEIDLTDERAIWNAVARNCDPARNLQQIEASLLQSDQQAVRLGRGWRVTLDATRQLPGEHGVLGSPPLPQMSTAVQQLITERWASLDLPDWLRDPNGSAS